MNRTLNFLHLTTFYPPYSFGGDAMYLYRLCHALGDAGHHCDVIHCIDAYHLLHAAEPPIRFVDHPNVSAHGLRSGYKWLSPLLTQQTGRPLLKQCRIQEILDSKPYDVIHYHNISLLGPTVLTLKPRSGRPVKLYTTHEHWLICPTHVLWKFNRKPCESPDCLKCTLLHKRPPQMWRYTGLLARTSRHVDQFLSPSRFTARMHAERGFPCPVDYLPLFSDRVDGDWQHPGVRPQERPYFLFVGRLEYIKGLQTLIALWKRVPNHDLLVVGTGSYEAELRTPGGRKPPHPLPRLPDAAAAGAALLPCARLPGAFAHVRDIWADLRGGLRAQDTGHRSRLGRPARGDPRQQRRLHLRQRRALTGCPAAHRCFAGAAGGVGRERLSDLCSLVVARSSSGAVFRLPTQYRAAKTRPGSVGGGRRRSAYGMYCRRRGAAMTGSGIDILMYHSISDGPGPTCMAPERFRRQMEALAERGYRGVALADLASWLRGESQPAGKPIVLTFDDAFSDFAAVAFPELQVRGWTATVFLPAGKTGKTAHWDVRPDWPAQRLLSWQAITDLAKRGIEIGAHGVSHTDLTTLPLDGARQEVVDARQRIEDRIGCPVTSFAAPYGHTTPAIRAEIRRHYRAAVGTDLARARSTSDPYNLPRIEMWYFRDPRRWQSYLEGEARGYLLLRQVLRRMRALLAPPGGSANRC